MNSRALAVVQLAGAVDRRDALDMRPRLAAERAGVHRERAADAARNPREERGRTELPAHTLASQQRARQARARAHAAAVEPLELARQRAGRDHDAAHPAVAHEQVRPEAEPEQRHAARQRREDLLELRDARGLVEKIRGAADAP